MKNKENIITIALIIVGFTALALFRPGGGQCSLVPFNAPNPAAISSLPAWTMTGADGTSHSSAEIAGRPSLTVFWATWCVNCRREMPALEALHEELGDELAIVAVSLDDPDGHDLGNYLSEHTLPFNVLHPTPQERAGFGTIRAVPTSLLADADGTVLARFEGPISEQAVREALALTD